MLQVSVAAPKKSISFRLDPDVVDGIKASGPGYNNRVGAALRAMLAKKNASVQAAERKIAKRIAKKTTEAASIVESVKAYAPSANKKSQLRKGSPGSGANTTRRGSKSA
jgi:hypothetical protein